MRTDKDKMITDEIILLFEETFNNVEGFFLDKKTSLFESIQDLKCSEVSKKVEGSNETIAGHIFHVTFYIRILQEYITDIRTGETDWNESWVISSVSEEEWKELKDNLSNEYEKLLSFIKSIDEWKDSDYFGGVLSILAHCSYHLGAIRQLLASLS